MAVWTYLKGEVLVGSHKTDALKVVGHAPPSTLLLRECGERSTSSALTLTNIYAKGCAIWLTKGTGGLIVRRAKAPSATSPPK